MNIHKQSPPSTHSRPKAIGLAFALTAAVVAFPVAANAAQATVGLGTAQSFAVLAGAGITNTGPTTLSGSAGADIGSYPTTTFTGEADVTTSGTKYLLGEAIVQGAKDDLVTAYNDAAGRGPTNPVSADLGGQTLVAGVYNSASSLGLTGTVTLDAENDPSAVFIFQAGSTLTTASASSVALVNGAQACNVFWQVGSSATFGTTTDFVGHVLALDSITATTGATFDGQLLARDGAVTLDSNTIVNDVCADTSTPEDTTEDTTEDTPEDSSSEDTSNGSSDSEPEAETPTPEDTTVDGGELPNTGGVGWLIALVVGVGIVAAGSILFARNRRSL